MKPVLFILGMILASQAQAYSDPPRRDPVRPLRYPDSTHNERDQKREKTPERRRSAPPSGQSLCDVRSQCFKLCDPAQCGKKFR